MSVVKVIEVMASSPKRWEDAAQTAVAKASKSLNNMASVYVQDQSCTVKDGKIESYRVNLKLSLKLKD
jgi:flavin-binding protein dodecin